MLKPLITSIAILSSIILITGCAAIPTAPVTATPNPSHTMSPPSPTPTIIATPTTSAKPSTTATSGIIKGTDLYNPFGLRHFEYVATITDNAATRPYKWMDSNITLETYNGTTAYHWQVNEYGNIHNLAEEVDYYYNMDQNLLGGYWKKEQGTNKDFSPGTGVYVEANAPRNYDYRFDGTETVNVHGSQYQDARRYVAQKTPYDSVTIWVDSYISIPIKIEIVYSNVRITYELTGFR